MHLYQTLMTTEDKHFTALKVNKGIEQPSPINDEAAKSFVKKKKTNLGLNDYVNGIRSGNISMLSQAITLIESSLPKHYALAQKIIEKCIPHSGNSIRIGVTGVPGVGKSTFIEALGKNLTAQGYKLAVLAIDPSSEVTGGSILGDKTRMEELSSDPNAFIRPSPSAGTLGGVTRKTRESIILCEAAGFNVVFVETVGVGQSETAVNCMIDFFLLLMLAGAGDELQGIKRGIMEMADAIAINKADGDNVIQANTARIEYTNALHLFPPTESGWIPQVDICSSRTKEGIDRIWTIIMDYINFTRKQGYFEKKRQSQAKYRMYEMINETLKSDFYAAQYVSDQFAKVEEELLQQRISSYAAAQKLLDSYFKHLQKK